MSSQEPEQLAGQQKSEAPRARIIDKKGILSRASSLTPVVLELGCGPARRDAGRIGVDELDFPAVDIVGDVFDVLAQFAPGSVSAVYSSHFFEHVSDLRGLLRELARVLPSGGRLEIDVPHFSNPYFYSDPTHVRAFGLYSFSYLAESRLFRRGVPSYDHVLTFVLEDVILQFDSPFLVRKIVRRLIGPLFNVSRWFQEFHEENLCYLIPAYQIRFVLRRR